MQLSSKVRMNRLFNNGKCTDGDRSRHRQRTGFLDRLEDIERVMGSLIAAP